MMGIFYSIWKMNARQKSNLNRVTIIDILPNSKLDELGVYMQDEYRVSQKIRFQLGIRGNYIHSKADGAPNSDEFIFSGSTGMIYEISHGMEIKLSVNKGFKSATPVERYLKAPMIDGFYRIGEPRLASETNLSKRISIKGMRGKFNWGLEIYHNSLSNLISAVVDTTLSPPTSELKGVKKFTNIQSAIIAGGSAFLNIALTGSIYLSSSLSYDWGINRKTGEPVPGIAPLRLTAKLTYETEKYWLELSGRFASNQNRFAKRYGEVRTPGYAIFNIKGGWKLGKTIELSAGIKNLFNRYYRDHLNLALLPEPGRNIYLSIRISIPITYQRKFKFNKIDIAVIKVEGMACEFCARTVRERLNSMDGVISVDVMLLEKEVKIKFAPERISANELVNLIKRAGFEAYLLNVLPTR
jgi:outer membrane receptor protein involved in Fe transport/copper chaperone CopZ